MTDLRTLNNLAREYQARRQYGQALTCSRQALEFVKDHGSEEDKAPALANLGCVYWEMAQLKKAMDLFQQALGISEENGDGAGRAILLTILGISYWRKCEWNEAILLMEKALNAISENEAAADPLPSGDEWRYHGLQEAIVRGVSTLKNRIQIARERQDPLKVLLPAFSMLPLLLFTSLKEEIPDLLEEIIALAKKFKRDDILNAIPKFQRLMVKE